MKNLDKNVNSEMQDIDYEIVLSQTYEFIKSKGLESEYKKQLPEISKRTIEHIDSINSYTGL